MNEKEFVATVVATKGLKKSLGKSSVAVRLTVITLAMSSVLNTGADDGAGIENLMMKEWSPMYYYEIRDNLTGQLVARGNAQECKKQLGCSSIDSFYALANRSLRGKNKRYTVIKKKGGETEYPVLGEDDPIHEYGPGIMNQITENEAEHNGV